MWGAWLILLRAWHMYTHRLLFASSGLAIVMASSVLAADDATKPQQKWLPALQLESDIGIGHNSRDIGLPQMMVPIWQDDRSMVFTDMRYRFDNEQSQEYNLGLGYRKEINSDWILGGYAFFDRLSSASGNLYSQGTFGLEALSVNNDARINVYVPQSTSHVISSTVVGTPQIIINGGQISIQDPGSSNSYERSLPGEDFEIGQKIPVNFADVRVYGGAYRYEADGFGMESGPRGRLELTVNDKYIPAIPLGAEITVGGEVEHDQIRGTESFVLAKLRIPLNGSKTYDTVSSLDSRMNTFIERDVDVITKKMNSITTGGQEAVEINGSVITNVVRLDWNSNYTTAINNASAGTLFLADSSGGAINGNNAAANMKTGQAILGLGTTVAITGVSSGRTVNYTFPQNLQSSAGIVGVGGFGNSSGINMANNTLIQNINFNGLDSGINTNGGNNAILKNDTFYESPLLIQGSNHVSLSNVNVRGSSPAIAISGSPSANITFANITVDNQTGGNGIFVLSNVNNLTMNGSYINAGGNSGTGDGLTFSNVSVTGLSGSGNTLISNGSNCAVSGSTISGSLTYNGSTHCP